MLTEIIVGLVLLLAFRISLEKSVIKCILYSAVLSVLVGVAFYTLKAPDLAITQISVNAVLLTLLFAYTVSKYEEKKIEKGAKYEERD